MSDFTVTTSDGSSFFIPSEFICPITLNPMVHPLMNKSGLNFEREAIVKWLASNGSCPMTRMPMKPSDFIPNRPLEARIRFWRLSNGIPDPFEQELRTVDCPFERYLPVETNEIAQRRSQSHISLRTLTSSVSVSSRDTTEQSHSSASVKRPLESEKRRRSFLSRILTDATSEIDGFQVFD
jgi:U-box domain